MALHLTGNKFAWGSIQLICIGVIDRWNRQVEPTGGTDGWNRQVELWVQSTGVETGGTDEPYTNTTCPIASHSVYQEERCEPQIFEPITKFLENLKYPRLLDFDPAKTRPRGSFRSNSWQGVGPGPACPSCPWAFLPPAISACTCGWQCVAWRIPHHAEGLKVGNT